MPEAHEAGWTRSLSAHQGFVIHQAGEKAADKAQRLPVYPVSTDLKEGAKMPETPTGMQFGKGMPCHF